MSDIQHVYIPTRGGNTLQIFYNPENDLLVVDLCGDEGGSELVRMHIDEEHLLEHLK